MSDSKVTLRIRGEELRALLAGASAATWADFCSVVAATVAAHPDGELSRGYSELGEEITHERAWSSVYSVALGQGRKLKRPRKPSGVLGTRGLGGDEILAALGDAGEPIDADASSPVQDVVVSAESTAYAPGEVVLPVGA